MRENRVLLRLGGLLLTLAALSQAGCGMMLLQGTTGFVASMKDVDRNGGTVNMHLNVGTKYLGFGPSLRMKFTDGLQHFGLGFEAIGLAPTLGPVTFYLRAGLHGSQFENLNSSFVYGIGSPFAEFGAMFKIYIFRLTVSSTAEYLVRLKRPDEGFWSVQLGFALLWRQK